MLRLLNQIPDSRIIKEAGMMIESELHHGSQSVSDTAGDVEQRAGQIDV